MAESVAGGRNRRVRRFFSHLWPRRLRWRITMLVALAVVIALTVWLILGRGEKTGATGGTQYRTSTVSAQTLKSSVSASGTLAPLHQESLSFDSSGTVTSVKVGVGATVTKGQTLATIDPAALKVALQTAKADLAAAQDSLDTLEDDSSATSTEISAAEAAVTVKQNAVTEARSNLAGATLTAPFAGVIAAVGISKGDSTGSSGGGGGSDSYGGSTDSSGSGSTTGTTSSSSSGSITLISKGTFTVTTSVSASDVGSVKKGMAATVTASGVTSAITGTVTSVGVVVSTSDSDSGSSTFPVTVTVAGTHTDLLPGASVTVAITTKQLSNVIAVATDAITTENGSTYVQRLVDGKPTRTKVTIGSVIGQQTVVKSGLKSGDQVIVATFKAAQGSGNASGSSSSGGGGMGGNGGGQMGGGGMGGGPGGGGMPGGSGGGQPGGR